MKSITIAIWLVLVPLVALAQSKDSNEPSYKYKREVSIDATAVLGNLLSLNSERAQSPYGFGYRRHFKNYSIRISGNTLFVTDETFEFNGIEFVERNTVEQEHNIRFAFEKGIDVAKNFRLLYSFDIMGGYKLTDSSTNFFNRKDQDFTIGLGPAIRLEYKISDRFLLTTESTLYGKYILNYDQFQLGSDPTQSSNGSNYSVLLALPTALTFSVGF